MGYGAKLAFCRQRAGYTIEKAAETMGISRNTLSNYEHDKTKIPISVIVKMSYLYKADIFDMLSVNMPQTEMDMNIYYLFKANAEFKVRDIRQKDIRFGSVFPDEYYTQKLHEVLLELVEQNRVLFPEIIDEFERDSGNIVWREI